MKGIVAQPQFDTQIFQIGQAIRVTWGKEEGAKSNDCLVISVGPISLEVCYWDPVHNQTEIEFIVVDHVIQGQIKFEILEPIAIETEESERP